ncbi:hypothetical protein GGS26DRAFT_579288 [Hypomontagnella submonticulosa]|nr:hypothetical protein GGS26DRAFT_579288 [Hypomontagnella submonticulosa]
MTVPKPQFAPGKQPDLPLSGENKAKVTNRDHDWLSTAEKLNRKDLETTEKELELIRGALSELEAGLETKGSSRRVRDKMYRMKACKEYSGSRLHMLEERLRQIQAWSSDEVAEEEVPDRVPDE